MSPHHIAWGVLWLDPSDCSCISTIIIIKHNISKKKKKKYHTGDVLDYIVTGIDQNRMVTALAGYLLRASGDDAVLPS